jgi:hypothetical protein
VHERSPDVHEHDAPPGDATAVYPVIVTPPVDVGGDQEMMAERYARVAETPCGCPGTVRGVTELDATDALLVPEAFVAVTVNV